MAKSSGKSKRTLRRFERLATTTWRRALLGRRRSEFKTVARWSGGPANAYFVMTDRGLYRADRDGVQRILDIPMYGCAIAGGKVYMALYIGHDTILVEGDAKALSGPAPFNFRPLFTEITNDTNERLHQVTNWGDGIWVARTGNGSIMRYESGSDVLVNHILLTDRFGSPVKKDINHINSVMQYGNTVLFTATHAGTQSMIGLMDGKKVTGFGYRNTGVHDIYLTEDGFLFFDTFGERDSIVGGRPVTDRGTLFPDLFGKPPGFVPRGAAQTGAEIVIGSSHKGERKTRFKGNGQLIVTEAGAVRSVVTLPVAQVYQIVNERGEFLKAPSPAPDAAAIRRMFESALGKPIYEGEATVNEIPVGAEV